MTTAGAGADAAAAGASRAELERTERRVPVMLVQALFLLAAGFSQVSGAVCRTHI
jgi:hypothetical protein